jgi:predicted RNA-binding Zn ribbon-like protein
MSSITSKLPGFEFIGGNVCLDFANTVSGTRDGRSQENLTSYADLVRWSRETALVTEGQAKELLRAAERDEGEAATVLTRARALREAIYHIFTALIAGTQPAEVDIEALNRELRKGTTGASIILTTDGFVWEWGKEEDAFDQMLGPLARSAATLLMSAERHLVRQCANVRCGWLFVDATKNHRRHWCRTAICGNKVRVRRHRQRQRNEGPFDMGEERLPMHGSPKNQG